MYINSDSILIINALIRLEIYAKIDNHLNRPMPAQL